MEGRQWPEVLDFVARFCTSRESENTRTCDRAKRTRTCDRAKRVKFSHVRVFSDSRNVQKKCDTNHISRATAWWKASNFQLACSALKVWRKWETYFSISVVRALIVFLPWQCTIWSSLCLVPGTICQAAELGIWAIHSLGWNLKLKTIPASWKGMEKNYFCITLITLSFDDVNFKLHVIFMAKWHL